MSDSSSKKIASRGAASGSEGEALLVQGAHVGLRLWRDERPAEAKPVSTRPYEVVGYVVAGRAELVLSDDVIALEPGDSYLVPAGVAHSYHILEPFTAVEATSPPASGKPTASS